MRHILKPFVFRKPLWIILFAMMTVSTLSAKNAERFFTKEKLTEVGVYYYPEHWDSAQWERDFRNMAEMGFEFTHFAEFAWAQLEPEEGKYDFRWLDRALQLADKYHLKVIMCTSTATPPVWLVRKHPEVLETSENGRQMDHGGRQHASFSSNYYRQYSLKMIEQLARHYGKDSRIIGWQLDNEPRRFLDYGKDASLRFREWLQNKYKTIEVVNKVWGTNFWSGTYTNFNQINLPLHSQWGMNLHQRLDHYRFADNETASFLDDQARVIRQFSNSSQWITTNYIPSYDVSYIGASKELDFNTYTRYMVYGSDRGIGTEGYRVGEYSRIAMANDYFRPLSGTYGVMELQPGQVNWGSINPQPLPGAVRLWLWHVFAGGSKLTCTYRYRAPLYGYEAFHYGIEGTDGVSLTPGGKEFCQFIQEIKKLREANCSGSALPNVYEKRKTGILYNVDNVMAINMNRQTAEWHTESHFLKYYKALKSFGCPVDFIRNQADFSQYPVLIVPAYQMIDQALIDRLLKYAENGGNLVMSCRSGLQNENGHLWEAKFYQPIYNLIGSSIDSYDLPMSNVPGTIQFEQQNFAWNSWGDLLNPYPGTEVWGEYGNSFYAGTPAVVSRKAGKGTVTYIGVDSRTGELEKNILAKLYHQQKIEIENYPPGVIVEYRDGFGIALNYSDKDYEMNLPVEAEIIIGEINIPTAGVLVWKY